MVISLALGIGANTALFSAVNGVLLKKIDVRDPDSLVRLRWAGRNDMSTNQSDYGFSGFDATGQNIRATFSFPMFQQFLADNQTMEEILASYSVARRTNEIGIRMALGAQRVDVLRQVLKESMTLVVVGVIVGLAIAFGAGRLVSSQLFGIEPTDTTTMVLAILTMVMVAAVAGYLPARRAAGVDPMVALRSE